MKESPLAKLRSIAKLSCSESRFTLTTATNLIHSDGEENGTRTGTCGALRHFSVFIARQHTDALY